MDAPLLPRIPQPDVQVRRVLVVAPAGDGLSGQAEQVEQADAVSGASLQGARVLSQHALLVPQEVPPGLRALWIGLERLDQVRPARLDPRGGVPLGLEVLRQAAIHRHGLGLPAGGCLHRARARSASSLGGLNTAGSPGAPGWEGTCRVGECNPSG